MNQNVTVWGETPGRVRPTYEWPYVVRMYYGPDAPAPKQLGELALETVHKSRSSAELELWVARQRDDIGEAYMLGPWSQ